MSPLRLDHVVIAVADLERAVVEYAAAGFTVQPGGRHPGRNTHNALVVFADGAYLELIAYGAPSPDERWWRELSQHGEGYVDFALLPKDLASVVADARRRGLDALQGPLEGGRLRPDGVRLAWQTARPATHDLPFLCADVTPRALRVPEGEVRRHANGATGVQAVRVAVRDLEATLARYRAYLGPEAVEGDEVVLQDSRIRFSAAGRARDEGPCAMTLAFAPGGTRPDAALLHGAALE